MISSITFEDNSPFYGYSLRNLGKVTVFFGQNNSGKTALLDALYEINKNGTAYVSMDEFAFCFSDRTESLIQGSRKLRENMHFSIMTLFFEASVETKGIILRYLFALTGINLSYHSNHLDGHFVQHTDDGDFYIDLLEIGDAYVMLFAVLVFMLAKKKEIIIIDEPELSLHADMQKKLFNILKSISEDLGIQVFIATHSQLFIDRDNPKNNFKIKNEDGHKIIEQLQTTQDIYIATYQLLGNSPADIFMPSNFIIVEGPSDKIFLVKLLQRFYKKEVGSRNIIIQPAHGDVTNHQVPKTFSSIEDLYMILESNSLYKDRVVILVDVQSPIVLKEFRHTYDIPRERLRSLGEINRYALEEAYPREVLRRLIKKHHEKISDPKDLVRAILRNKKHKKIEWAKRVGDEITFDEVPKIFKEVIELALRLSL